MGVKDPEKHSSLKEKEEKMKKGRFFSLTIFVIVAGMVILGVNSFCQAEYPKSPVSMVVAYSPGGATDFQARIVSMMAGLENGLGGYRARFIQPVSFFSDGDRINFDGMELQVIHCSGHSLGTVCFYEEFEGSLVSGDHFLARPIPNPVLDIDRDNSFNQLYGLRNYYQSMEKLKEFQINNILPGHGPEFAEFDNIYNRYNVHKDRYSRGILRHLKSGPASAFDVYSRLYKRLPGYVIYIGMSIIIGLLKILEEDGTVSSFEEDGVIKHQLS